MAAPARMPIVFRRLEGRSGRSTGELTATVPLGDSLAMTRLGTATICDCVRRACPSLALGSAVALAPTTSRRAARISLADAYRSAGSLDIALRQTASNPGSAPGRIDDGTGGSSLWCLTTTPRGVGASNGGLPHKR